MAWEGLNKYGYNDVTKRIAYRWLYSMTKAFVDYHGVLVEKYDVTRVVDPHKVDAEYGNQGGDIRGVALEGYVLNSSQRDTVFWQHFSFGWVNASYQIGLDQITTHMKRALSACIPPDAFVRLTADEQELVTESLEALGL